MNAAGSIPLRNPRHEVFAKAVATHGFQAKAAIEAGYKPTAAPVCGWKLIRRDDVKERVNFLREHKGLKVATKKELTKVWVIDRMREVAEEAIKNKEKAAAIKALELLGREVGAFVERKQLEVVSPLDTLPAAALLVLIENLTQPNRKLHDLDLIAADQTTAAPRPGDLELLGVEYEDMGQGNAGVTDQRSIEEGTGEGTEQTDGVNPLKSLDVWRMGDPSYQGADTAEQSENVEAPHPPLFGGPPSRSSTTVSKSTTTKEGRADKARKAAELYEALATPAPSPGAPRPGPLFQTGEEDFDDV